MGTEQEKEELIWNVKNGECDGVDGLMKKLSPDTEINGRCPLHFAADYGQTKVIELLIKKGAKVNTPDKYGITPLLSAIYEGHTDAVRALLAAGADKTGKTPDGASYIDAAETQAIKDLLK